MFETVYKAISSWNSRVYQMCIILIYIKYILLNLFFNISFSIHYNIFFVAFFR